MAWLGNFTIDNTQFFTLGQFKEPVQSADANTKKDELGRYTSGMWIEEYSNVYASPLNPNDNNKINEVSKRRYAKKINSDSAIAILDIPILCSYNWTYNRTVLNPDSAWSYRGGQLQEIDRTSIQHVFLLITNNKSSYVTTNSVTGKSNYYVRRINMITEKEVGGETYNRNILTNDTDSRQVLTELCQLLTQLERFNNESISNAGTDYPMYSNIVKESLIGYLESEEGKERILKSNLKFAPAFSVSLVSGRQNGRANRIFTTIPVFRYDKIDKMLDYFDTGSLDGVSNEEDVKYLELTPTDWTIYIDGKYPTVALTWKCMGIESFFETHLEDNYSMEDVKIEIEIPKVVPTKLEAGGIIEGWKKDVDLSYGDPWYIVSFKAFINKIFSGYVITNINEKAVKLKFRLTLDSYHSSWCECHITYIGMENEKDWGGIAGDSLNDGSTVKLIYGKLPEDNGYETDDDPSDVTGEDTSPSDFNLSNVLTKTYEVKQSRLEQLGDFLWSASFFDNIKLISNSPIENIVGCKQVPIALSGADEEIVIGNVNTGVNGEVISNSKVLDIGSIYINGIYGSFLDYSPYTQITIFLPFIGFQDIDSSKFMNKKLSVKYVFDLVSGACKAMIFCDDIYVQSFDGQAGIDVPLTSSNRAQQDAAFIGSMLPGVSFGATLLGKGSKSKMLHGSLTANTDVAIPQYHYSTKGGYSPTCGFFETRLCYLIFNRPVVQYPSSYGHNAGYPCNLTCTLGTLSGFTIVDRGIDLSGIPCTQEERDMILEYLTTGVYL